MMAAFGIHIGTYLHVLAAAAGLSLLYKAVPAVFLGIQYAGAAYLAWLGINLFRAEPPAAALSDFKRRPPRQAFLESIMVEVLNPKTAIFYLAFLPQFTSASSALPVWAQFLLLGAIVNIIFSSSDVAYVLLAHLMVRRLQASPLIHRSLRFFAGSLLIGLGVHLVLQNH